MYVHVKVGLGKVEKVLEKVRKKSKKVWKKVKKLFTKKVTSCQSIRKNKNFGTFPREQRLERGLRLPRVYLNSPQLLTNGPTPHSDSVPRPPSTCQYARM